MAGSSGDTVTRYVLTISSALTITIIVAVLLIYILPLLSGVGFLIKWGLLPLIGYFVSMGFNAIIQNLQCDKITMKQLLLVSGITPVSIYIGLIITSFMPFLLYPVRAAAIQLKDDVINNIAITFITFWGALYSQIIAATFVATCPK